MSPIPVLVAMATANAVLAVVLADATPDRSADLWMLRAWIQDWMQGRDLFATPGTEIDYPPWAVVTFGVLGLLPQALVIPVCSLGTVAVMLCLAFVSAQVMAPRAAPQAIVIPALLVLCWGAAIRTIIVTTPLCLLFALLAVRWQDRPARAGGCLGLALAKPHIALPFLLWACVRGRFRIAAVAVAVVALQLSAFSLWTGSEPVATTIQWIANVQAMYTGDTEFVGLTGVRAWFDDWMHDPEAVDALTIAFATAGLMALFRMRGRSLPSGAPLVVPVGCCWVLLSFYHYQEDLTLLVPAFMTAYFSIGPFGGAARVLTLLVMQAILMSDIRRRGWLVPIDAWPIPDLLEHSYRLVTLASVAYVGAIAGPVRRTAAAARARAMIAIARGWRVSLSRREQDRAYADRHHGADRVERPGLGAGAGSRGRGIARPLGLQPWPDTR